MPTMTLETGLTYNIADADTEDRAVLGGKGAGLVEMTRLGLRVPPAFVLATSCCAAYLERRSLPAELIRDVETRLSELEDQTGKTFGGGPVPLLLSVRSGAPVSMPGMMDTVLNLGLDRHAAIALAEMTGSVRFMADVLARFHAMYAEIVLDVLEPAASPVEAVLAELGEGAAAGDVYDRVWAALQAQLEDAGEDTVPDDPHAQLRGAIEAVFRSWNTRRAITYRDLHGIDHAMGTAVVVQSMVFGNRDRDSGSGVVFSRNPVTGEPGLYGEYLAASQGEDVVAGIRTPDPVASLARTHPHVHEELRATVERLEREHRDVLDIEFTVESGTLFLLQVRSAKRTGPAAVRIASDFLAEHGSEAASILGTVSVDHLRSLTRPRFDAASLEAAREGGRIIARGIGASPGQVSGRLALSPDRAEQLAAQGHAVILARAVTSPTDLHGMIAAQAVVTATGGATSHAAVVARALGRTCVVGCSDLSFDEQGVSMRAGDLLFREGDELSVDGDTGEVYAGVIPVDDHAGAGDDVLSLAQFCTQLSQVRLSVRVAAEADVHRARALGARGVVIAAADVIAMSPDASAALAAVAAGGSDAAAQEAIAAAVERGMAPILRAAEGLEVGVRGVDFLVDETSELLGSEAVLVTRPELALPLGSRSLVEAQLRGLLAAVDAVPRSDVRFFLRNVSDEAEARILASLTEDGNLGAGAYIASPRGALNVGPITTQLHRSWIELRLVQAAMYGLPPRLFLTREPFDEYTAQGGFSANPRNVLDPSLEPLLAEVASVATRPWGDGVGLRITGPVSEPVLGDLYARGFRRFAVDLAEAEPALLVFAKTAAGQL